MAHAIELARRAWGNTHPNPLVGAVIVESGEIVAEGWHQRSGEAHAEVNAIKDLGRAPGPDATMYVTMEPCSTEGRTGACTTAIQVAGIRRVVIGTLDPNPAHAGRGVDILKNAGVEVTHGVLAAECDDLNPIFNHLIVEGRPLIAGKLALTLDGKFAAASGHSRWVTGETARADVMRWRRYFPAIAVGAETLLQDNPSLTSRIGDEVHCPRRLIFDRTLRTLERGDDTTVFTDAFRDQTTLISVEGVDSERLDVAKEQEIDVWVLPADSVGYPSWEVFLEKCAAAELFGVYVEAGPQLATTLIESGRVDYLLVYQAAKFMSDQGAIGIGSKRETQSMAEAIELSEVRHEILGEDILTRGKVKS